MLFCDFIPQQIGLAVDNIKETLKSAVVKRRAWRVIFSTLLSSLHTHLKLYLMKCVPHYYSHISTIISFTTCVIEQLICSWRYVYSQVELVLNVEEVLPTSLRRYFIVGSREIHPNRDLTWWEQFVYSVWGRQTFDSFENINKALHPPLVSFLNPT